MRLILSVLLPLIWISSTSHTRSITQASTRTCALMSNKRRCDAGSKFSKWTDFHTNIQVRMHLTINATASCVYFRNFHCINLCSTACFRHLPIAYCCIVGVWRVGIQCLIGNSQNNISHIGELLPSIMKWVHRVGILVFVWKLATTTGHRYMETFLSLRWAYLNIFEGSDAICSRTSWWIIELMSVYFQKFLCAFCCFAMIKWAFEFALCRFFWAIDWIAISRQ